MTTRDLTRTLADRHEALYPKLETLTRQAEAMAARQAAAPVPAATRAAAETLLYEAGRFTPARRGLVATPDDIGGLATVLGQALAALDAFEAANSFWQADQQCRVWDITGPPAPVRRLRPVLKAPIRANKQNRIQANIRQLLLDRIQARIATAYHEGYRDAQNGVPQRD